MTPVGNLAKHRSARRGLMRAWPHHRDAATALAFVLALSAFGVGCVDPVDVIVYAERLPSFFRVSPNGSPAPFANPFTDAKLPGHPDHPENVYVVASPGGQWGAWRRLPSRSTATHQPAAADVHGDTNLVTLDGAGLAEEAAQ
jgi:hypothetical protein